jgi:tetratricopeptide (TPR) repeat protein
MATIRHLVTFSRYVSIRDCDLQWAQTQMNLGNALQALAAMGSGTDGLEAAAIAYRAALEEWSRDRVPLDWAMAQHNLGNALSALGERESGTRHLEEAVAAFQAALDERTRDRVPLEWAMSTGNQGITLMLLAGRLKDPEKARRAVTQIETAFVTMRDGGDPTGAAIYEGDLEEARALLDSLAQR